MSVQKWNGWRVLILTLAFTCAANAADITGTWAIQDLQIANKLQLSLNTVQNGKGTTNSSSAIDASELRGLTPGQMAVPMGTVARFELVREAGTFTCEGYFKAGNGAGTFVFRPNPSFIQDMRALGFLDIPEDRLFTMAVFNIGPRFASEIRATGVAIDETSELVSMRIHGVTGDFIRGIQRANYSPTSKELVNMRIHGVTIDFANAVQRMYTSAPIAKLVNMRIHGVTLEFANDVRQIFPSASIDDLVKLRIHGVTLEYIRNLRSRSGNLTLDQIVRSKIHGIE